MSISLTITGTEELRAALERIGEKAQPIAAAALYQEAETIMADSKEHYVPVEHGALRDSGHVQLPEIQGDAITVRLGFGGAASAYAIAVHEHLSAHSPRSWRIAEAAGRPVRFSPGGPKFLELPLLDAAKNLAAHIGDRIRAALRSAG